MPGSYMLLLHSNCQYVYICPYNRRIKTPLSAAIWVGRLNVSSHSSLLLSVGMTYVFKDFFSNLYSRQMKAEVRKNLQQKR